MVVDVAGAYRMGYDARFALWLLMRSRSRNKDTMGAQRALWCVDPHGSAIEENKKT